MAQNGPKILFFALRFALRQAQSKLMRLPCIGVYSNPLFAWRRYIMLGKDIEGKGKALTDDHP